MFLQNVLSFVSIFNLYNGIVFSWVGPDIRLGFSIRCMGFPHSSVGKESFCNAGDPIRFLCWEDMLEKG